jgi:iron-regulated transporter 1
MTAVLSWRGISPLTLGLARAVAALVGILATVCYPVWHRRVQGLRTGLRAIWLQVGNPHWKQDIIFVRALARS